MLAPDGDEWESGCSSAGLEFQATLMETGAKGGPRVLLGETRLHEVETMRVTPTVSRLGSWLSLSARRKYKPNESALDVFSPGVFPVPVSRRTQRRGGSLSHSKAG